MTFISFLLWVGGVWWLLWGFGNQKTTCGGVWARTQVVKMVSGCLYPLTQPWGGLALFFFFTIKISYTIQQQQQKHSNGRKWKQSTEIKDTLQFCCFVKSVHVCLDFLFFHLHKGQNPAGTIKLKQSTSSICSWENTILWEIGPAQPCQQLCPSESCIDTGCQGDD